MRKSIKRSCLLLLLLFLIYSLIFMNSKINVKADTHSSHEGFSEASVFNNDALTLNITDYYLDEGKYYLTEDVTLNQTFRINSNVEICLNGYTLDLNGHYIYVYGDDSKQGSLKIYDCSSEQTGTIVNNSTNELGQYFILSDYGDIILYSGTIIKSKYTHCLVTSYSNANDYSTNSFTIAGGKVIVKSCNAGDIAFKLGSTTFNMQGGEITTDRKAEEYLFYSYTNFVFNMSGGLINKTNDLVYIDNNYDLTATFNFTGGTIKNAGVLSTEYNTYSNVVTYNFNFDNAFKMVNTKGINWLYTYTNDVVYNFNFGDNLSNDARIELSCADTDCGTFNTIFGIDDETKFNKVKSCLYAVTDEFGFYDFYDSELSQYVLQFQDLISSQPTTDSPTFYPTYNDGTYKWYEVTSKKEQITDSMFTPLGQTTIDNEGISTFSMLVKKVLKGTLDDSCEEEYNSLSLYYLKDYKYSVNDNKLYISSSEPFKIQLFDTDDEIINTSILYDMYMSAYHYSDDHFVSIMNSSGVYEIDLLFNTNVSLKVKFSDDTLIKNISFSELEDNEISYETKLGGKYKLVGNKEVYTEVANSNARSLPTGTPDGVYFCEQTFNGQVVRTHSFYYKEVGLIKDANTYDSNVFVQAYDSNATYQWEKQQVAEEALPEKWLNINDIRKKNNDGSYKIGYNYGYFTKDFFNEYLYVDCQFLKNKTYTYSGHELIISSANPFALNIYIEVASQKADITFDSDTMSFQNGCGKYEDGQYVATKSSDEYILDLYLNDFDEFFVEFNENTSFNRIECNDDDNIYSVDLTPYSTAWVGDIKIVGVKNIYTPVDGCTSQVLPASVDNGTYRCKVTNSANKVFYSSLRSIEVQVITNDISYLSNEQLYVNTSVDDVTYQWYKVETKEYAVTEELLPSGDSIIRSGNKFVTDGDGYIEGYVSQKFIDECASLRIYLLKDIEYTYSEDYISLYSSKPFSINVLINIDGSYVSYTDDYYFVDSWRIGYCRSGKIIAEKDTNGVYTIERNFYFGQDFKITFNTDYCVYEIGVGDLIDEDKWFTDRQRYVGSSYDIRVTKEIYTALDSETSSKLSVNSPTGRYCCYVTYKGEVYKTSIGNYNYYIISSQPTNNEPSVESKLNDVTYEWYKVGDEVIDQDSISEELLPESIGVIRNQDGTFITSSNGYVDYIEGKVGNLFSELLYSKVAAYLISGNSYTGSSSYEYDIECQVLTISCLESFSIKMYTDSNKDTIYTQQYLDNLNGVFVFGSFDQSGNIVSTYDETSKEYIISIKFTNNGQDDAISYCFVSNGDYLHQKTGLNGTYISLNFSFAGSFKLCGIKNSISKVSGEVTNALSTNPQTGSYLCKVSVDGNYKYSDRISYVHKVIIQQPTDNDPKVVSNDEDVTYKWYGSKNLDYVDKDDLEFEYDEDISVDGNNYIFYSRDFSLSDDYVDSGKDFNVYYAVGYQYHSYGLNFNLRSYAQPFTIAITVDLWGNSGPADINSVLNLVGTYSNGYFTAKGVDEDTDGTIDYYAVSFDYSAYDDVDFYFTFSEYVLYKSISNAELKVSSDISLQNMFGSIGYFTSNKVDFKEIDNSNWKNKNVLDSSTDSGMYYCIVTVDGVEYKSNQVSKLLISVQPDEDAPEVITVKDLDTTGDTDFEFKWYKETTTKKKISEEYLPNSSMITRDSDGYINIYHDEYGYYLDFSMNSSFLSLNRGVDVYLLGGYEYTSNAGKFYFSSKTPFTIDLYKKVSDEKVSIKSESCSVNNLAKGYYANGVWNPIKYGDDYVLELYFNEEMTYYFVFEDDFLYSSHSADDLLYDWGYVSYQMYFGGKLLITDNTYEYAVSTSLTNNSLYGVSDNGTYYCEVSYGNIKQVTNTFAYDYLHIKRYIDLTLVNTEEFYTGQGISFELTGNDKDLDVFTIEYYVNNAWTTTAPINAGTYNVKVSLADCILYYAYSDQTKSVVIKKAKVAEPTIATSSYTYDKSEKQVTVNNVESYMTLVNTSVTKATNVGTYNISYTLDSNHEWDTGLDGIISWSIAKGTTVINVDTAPIVKTYGDTIIIPTATSNFGTVSCDKVVADLVNAGTYTITYSVTGTDNYLGDTKTISVTINKKEVNEPTITVNSFTFDNTEKQVSISNVESFMSLVNTSVTKAANVGTYNVSYTLDDNHKWASGSDGIVSWSIVGSQAVITVDTTPIVITFGDSIVIPAATSNFGTVTCDKVSSDLVNAGTYTITYSVTGTNDYSGDTKTISVTINKANAIITVDQSTITKKFGESVVLPNATSNFGTVTCDKVVTDLVNPGVYTVTYSVDGTSNYNGDSKSLTVNIKQDKITKKAEDNTTDTVIVTPINGFDHTISLYVKTVLADSVSSTTLTVDYSSLSQISKKEKVGVIYDIKLMNGNTIVSVPENETIKVKVLLPETLDVNKITKILHVHSDSSIDTIEFNINNVSNGYYEFETNNFSEFAFICEADKTGLPWWAVILVVLLSLIVIFVAVFVLWYLEIKKFTKDNLDLNNRKLKVLDNVFNPVKEYLKKLNINLE